MEKLKRGTVGKVKIGDSLCEAVFLGEVTNQSCFIALKESTDSGRKVKTIPMKEFVPLAPMANNGEEAKDAIKAPQLEGKEDEKSTEVEPVADDRPQESLFQLDGQELQGTNYGPLAGIAELPCVFADTSGKIYINYQGKTVEVPNLTLKPTTMPQELSGEQILEEAGLPNIKWREDAGVAIQNPGSVPATVADDPSNIEQLTPNEKKPMVECKREHIKPKRASKEEVDTPMKLPIVEAKAGKSGANEAKAPAEDLSYETKISKMFSLSGPRAVNKLSDGSFKFAYEGREVGIKPAANGGSMLGQVDNGAWEPIQHESDVKLMLQESMKESVDPCSSVLSRLHNSR